MQTMLPTPTPSGLYAQLVRRQRAELQDAYMQGVRRLRWGADRLAVERQRRLRELLVLESIAERVDFGLLTGGIRRWHNRALHDTF